MCSGKPLKRAQLSIRRGMCCIYEKRHTNIMLFRIVSLILHLFSNYFLWQLDMPCKHTYWIYCVIIPYFYLLGLCPQRGTYCPTLTFSLQCRLEKLMKLLGLSDTFNSCKETITVTVKFSLMGSWVIHYSPKEMSNFVLKNHEINEMARIPAVVCLRATPHLSSNEHYTVSKEVTFQVSWGDTFLLSPLTWKEGVLR